MIKLSAVCVYCAHEAAFTLRTIDSQEIELIGGEESYKPVCRKCYHEKVENLENRMNKVQISQVNPESTQVQVTATEKQD